MTSELVAQGYVPDHGPEHLPESGPDHVPENRLPAYLAPVPVTPVPVRSISVDPAAGRQCRPRPLRLRPHRLRPHLAARLLVATALLSLPYATAATASAAAPRHGVLTHNVAGQARTLPDRNQGPGRPDDVDHAQPTESDADTDAGTPRPTTPLDALGRLVPIVPALPSPSGGPASGSGTDDPRPAFPPGTDPSANDLSADADAGPQNGHASRPPSPAASKAPGKPSPAPTRPRRSDLAGRLANRPYVPLPPLQAPSSSAAAARPHGPSRYAPGAVPGAASAAQRTPGTAAEQGNGVHRVLPLGAGMALTGLGLAFIALRLRRS
ncbi:hypothetical protein SRIMHP_17510 [Streptomyces rimosus subsp. rimosus]|uniref:Gram-positive cocci surface proteins LPxTG domain-containing protein n=1 Tax=Streptomyces rimosus subsp. rimosus TaxID=132474 RepID=A0ABY3Z3A9_STRRM|nr:hypothetical protein SRIMR7_20030 [Streptomyces rimosus subsp. rimosus]UTH95927.1 hypothetical protein SRIMHP_17510 [Streptomyces rimosus subsp. rimosus]UTJ14024.1 hypothetical protein SRIMDV3_17405 [Streptomyces rimosus subsp. rimosus]